MDVVGVGRQTARLKLHFLALDFVLFVKKLARIFIRAGDLGVICHLDRLNIVGTLLVIQKFLLKMRSAFLGFILSGFWALGCGIL